MGDGAGASAGGAGCGVAGGFGGRKLNLHFFPRGEMLTLPIVPMQGGPVLL